MNEADSTYDPNRDFITLDAWRKARELKLFFYKEVIALLPSEEKFKFNVQIRKASVSGTANISEGYGRFHHREGIQFYRVSRGSIYELKDHFFSCYDCGFVSKEIFEKGINLIEQTKMVLNGYIKYINSQKDQ